MPLADLLIIDEAHHACAMTYRKVIEAYPHGQKLSKTNSTIFGPKMSAADRKDVKSHLADKGVKLVNMGVGPRCRTNGEQQSGVT